ncbi:MAG: 3-isopropylmalate dehydrogenase [SAR202 cluster bacterium]|jgi:3-isopropylmalate dehydrogenase|nr:3-isopropylmalate dehydrogenase [Chloroflexota bacterium]MDP6420245.1 3-isopropylmalate dehydrogenase [SAR202 cluster bacterium]HAL48705.1 3-isopropylmalate dehydrogenase [Dehalococcoidia bacterium]MDP6664961.1 3-isopropylmalate dehydrogenase [SAR202 cluster bacterium]MDP6798716.1 3-isopropylmalate dehydrogenase [SAR202 cluster bacterium]|tara:strand:- start:2402 stop:3502 length:1101 start_codon:yes stop_codon:yes gene_type:complete
MQFKLTVLPGDGIGPEVIEESIKVLRAVGVRFGHEFEFQYGIVGGGAIDATGTPLPKETISLCRGVDAILFGAVGGPKWDDPSAKVRPEDGILAIRKQLGLFANLRPVKVLPALINSSPVKASLLEGVDMIVVRELTGGLYFASPKRRWETSRGRRGVDTLRYTEQEIDRILRVGFDLARRRKKRLTSVDKANVLESSRLWREIATEVACEYPDIELEHVLVDAAAMQLIRNPAHYDVIVAENMFGDILTDEASVLSGSLGMLPSASLAGLPKGGRAKRGNKVSLYEPIHGSAPDIAGQGIANPIGTVLSAAMMLRHSLGLEDEATAVERSVDGALAEGYRTPDIGSDGGEVIATSRMGSLIAGGI